MKNLKELLKRSPLLLRLDDGSVGMLYCDEIGKLFLEIASEKDFSGEKIFCKAMNGSGGFYLALGNKFFSLLPTDSARYSVRYVIWGRGEFNEFDEKELLRLGVRYKLFFPEQRKNLYERKGIDLGDGYVGDVCVLRSESMGYSSNIARKHFALECRKEDGAGICLSDIRKIVARIDAVLSCLVGRAMRVDDVCLIYGDERESMRIMQYVSGASEEPWPCDDRYLINDNIDFGVVLKGLMEKDLAPAFNLRMEMKDKEGRKMYYESALGDLFRSIDAMAGRKYANKNRSDEFDGLVVAIEHGLSEEDLVKFGNVLDFLKGTCRMIYKAGSFAEKMHRVLGWTVENGEVNAELFDDLCEYSNVQRNSIMHSGVLDDAKEKWFLVKHPDFSALAFLEEHTRTAVEKYICGYGGGEDAKEKRDRL